MLSLYPTLVQHLVLRNSLLVVNHARVALASWSGDIRDHWIKAKNLKMERLIPDKVWERVLLSSLHAVNKVFKTRFHYKIKMKGGKFDKWKVSLVPW